MQNPHFRSKIKIPKKNFQIHSPKHLELFCARNRSKKHSIFEKCDHFENRRSCKGYTPCKIPTLGQKLKFQKTCQNPFCKGFRVVLCKNCSKKHEIFEKWDHFKNRLSCKGYSPCQILTLSQKLKLKKNMSKSVLQIIYSCFVQKNAPKNTKYSRNETILKIGHHAKATTRNDF